METNDNEFAQEIASASNQQFYGLTVDGEMLALPEAPYANVALRLHAEACEAEGKSQPAMPMVFTTHQYRALMSAVEAELADHDGDGQKPSYCVIPYATQTPVFPHPSVDTDQEAKEFIEGYPLESVGPYKLSDIIAHWPKVVDPEPVRIEAPAEVEPD